nr:MAG TPA: hypothetical protein [Caudoviricetes sp.]
MCSAVLDYRRLVYSCQQPNLYNLHQIYLNLCHRCVIFDSGSLSECK